MKGTMRGEGTPLITYSRRSRLQRLGPHWAYAHPGNRLVRKDEVGWHTLSGIYVNTPWGQAWLYVRNWRTS